MICKYLWTSTGDLRKAKKWKGNKNYWWKRQYIGYFLFGFIPLYVKCIAVEYY